MDFETESQKKKFGAGVFGDVHTVTMMLPKELHLDKMDPPRLSSPPSLDLRFQLPPFKLSVRVRAFLLLLQFVPMFLILGGREKIFSIF